MGDDNLLPDGATFPVAAEPMVVGFEGRRAGTAELTWAQRHVWELCRAAAPRHHVFNLQRIHAVPADRRPADVVRAARVLFERHETFRTVVGRDRRGEPVQELRGSGQVRVEVYDGPPGRGAALVEVVAAEQAGLAFADGGWPLRVALITEAGRPRYAVLTASHVAVDRSAMEIACRSFAGALRGDDGPRAGYHPLDVAEEEASGNGRAMAERAVAYWRRALASAPEALVPWAAPGVPAGWPRSALLSSPAAGMATAVLAERHRVSRGAVLVAALASVLGVHFGADRLLLQVLCANRSGHQRRGMVGTAVQPGPLALDLDAPTFGEIVLRTGTAALAAYRYGRYPYPRIAELAAEVDTRRETPLDLGYIVQEIAADWPGGRHPPTIASIERAVIRTELRRDVVFRGGDERMRFEVSPGPEHAVSLGLAADPRLDAVVAVEELLRGMEAVLVAAAGQELTRADIRALAGPAGPPRAGTRPGVRAGRA